MIKRLLHFWDQTSFYLDKKVFYAGYGIAGLFVLSFFVPALQTVAAFLLLGVAVVILIDALLLYQKKAVHAERLLPHRLSNGDENKVVLLLHNDYGFPLHCTVIDELPVQFQERSWQREVLMPKNESYELVYHIRPTERGEYHFGRINVYANGPLTVVKRRFVVGEEQTTKVYPSYVQMRRYQLLAVGYKLNETGTRRMR